MNLMRVTCVDYTPKQDDGESDPTVRICGRGEGGERLVRYVAGTRPHCYVPERETRETLAEADCDILSIDSGYETFDGQAVKRVTVRHPKEVKAIEEAAEFSWESDIPYYRRATWDYGLSGYIRVPDARRCHVDDIETDIDAEDVDPIDPRTVVGDIEVYDPDGKSFDEMADAAEDPIVAVTLYDTFTEQFWTGIVDPEERADPSDVKAAMGDHWGDHDLREQYVEDARVSFVQFASEADLLNGVIGRIQAWQPDLLAGWNWIDFDHVYLTDRCHAVDGVDPHKLSDIGYTGGRSDVKRIDGLPGFDQMQAYEDKVTISENRSSKLEYIANEELGIGKLDSANVSHDYEENRARLAAYNLLDVQLCVALTEKHAIEEFYLDLGDLTGIQVYDVFYEKRLVDGWIASRKGDDQVLPNQVEKQIPRPAGGLVLSPSDGVTDNVAVLDLKSLYPSSMISCNISPETMVQDPDEADVVIPGMPEKESDVGGSIEPSDINWDDWDDSLPWSQRPKGFSLDDRGIVSEAAEGPFEERQRYKVLRDEYGPDDEWYVVYDRKQGAVKVVHNSMYGVLNSDYFRLAEPGMGDAITGVSRYVLWRASEYVEELGYEVIYGDTDSVLVKIPGDRKLQKMLLDAKGLASQLNSYMAEVADDLGLPESHPHVDASEMPHDLPDDANHLWFFEFEKFYDSFIQVGTKKRYAGKLAWKEGKTIDDDAEPDVTGFESQRADVPKITAEVQTEVIKLSLGGADFETVSGYVQDRIDEVRDQASLEEIGIPKSINKPLSQYPNRERVRAARHSNEHLGRDFGPGDTMWMFYAARSPTGVEGTDVFGIDWNEEIPEGYEVDEEKTIVKAFESALSPIVEEVGWSFEEVRSGKQIQAAEEATGFDGDPFAERGESEEPDESTEGSDNGGDDEWQGAEAW